MDRKQFLRSLLLLPLMNTAMKLKALSRYANALENTKKMPVLFIGHGSPMNAIEENEFVASFRKIGREIANPTAVLCISAHWETRGTFVTAMDNPRTIHDFGGFPQALFDVQYNAPGSPELAEEAKCLIQSTEVGLDHEWGLDHGAWTVVKHMYPNADVPVIQMSIDYTKPAQYHYELARELASLRTKGVLIVGSGNMVHNLRMAKFSADGSYDFGFDWALEANEKMMQHILSGDHEKLINFKAQGKAFKLAIPTPEHYLPLIYTLGLQEKKDKVSIFNAKALAGALTMTSVRIDS